MNIWKGGTFRSLTALGVICFLLFIPSCRKKGGGDDTIKTGTAGPTYRIGYMICDETGRASRRERG